jgi:hypothetical protein
MTPDGLEKELLWQNTYEFHSGKNVRPVCITSYISKSSPQAVWT